MYKNNCVQSKWRNAVVIPIFTKGVRRDPKTEELVFFTPAIRYTLKSLV
jgi:hypothetical protein